MSTASGLSETFGSRNGSIADVPDKYPLAIRVYGVLSIGVGVISIGSFVLSVVSVILNGIDFASLGRQTTTAVITGISLLLTVATSVLGILLGVRLLYGFRHRAALMANIMIILEAFDLVCQFMLFGVSYQLIPDAVNIVLLIALETYSDPALRQERALQRKLQELEWRDEAEKGTLGRDTTGKGFIQLNFFNIFWVFVICSIIGLIIETIYHMVVVEPGVLHDRAGLLYGPFSPMYGFGAVLMTLALNRFRNTHVLIVFLVSAAIGGTFEYFMSLFLEVAFGVSAWDYTGEFLSIDGRVCGLYICMWGVLGVAWIKLLLPVMLKLVNMIPWNWRYAVTTVCTVLLVIDGVLTLAALDCWYQRKAGMMDYEHASAIVQFCNEHYPDEFMERRFAAMLMDTNKAARSN